MTKTEYTAAIEADLKAAQGKPVECADKGKKTPKKKDGAKATQGKADTAAPEQAKAELPAA